MPHTLAAVSSFSSGRAYLSLNFLPPLFLRLIPTLIMYRLTSLLTTPPRCHFLMCTPPYSLLSDGWQNQLLFSLHSSLLQQSLHSGEHQLPSPALGLKRVLPTPAGRKYSTGSSPQTSSPSMTMIYPLFSIAPLAVAPLLTSPLSPLLLPFLAHGRCFRILVLTIYQFFYPSLSLRSFAPTSVLRPSIFRKLAGMTLPPTLTLTVLLQRNTRLFLFPLLLLFLPLWQ